MVGSLLLRGMLAGVLAGLIVFCVAKVFGEPAVDWAIGYEERVSAATAPDGGSAEEEPLVSRETQAGFGLLLGSLLYGAAIGGIFALVFALAYGRLGRLGPRGTALLLALAGFVAIFAIPQLKYPGNPPAVGSDDTIGARTGLFFAMLLLSVAVTAGALFLSQHLRPRLGGWNASLVAGAAFLGAVALLYAAMPSIREVPEDFSAQVLWDFRLASVGMHLALWTTLGLAFGPLAERLLQSRRGAWAQA